MKASKRQIEADLDFGHLVRAEGQYARARQTAEDDKIPAEVLPFIVAAAYAGCPGALDELNRGFAYLCFQVAERVAQTIKRRVALLPVMCVDLGDALRRCKESRKPANEVTAYLARELSNSPKHADDPGFIILESHKGKDRGKMVCRQSAHDPFCNRPDRDLREGRGPWRKPRGVAMHLTNDDDRERLRHKSGWYAGYTERAEDALRFLSLTGDEFEIVRHASWGDSPEEIVRMSRFNAEYVNGVIAGLPQRLRAHEEETERIARIRRADSRS